jgi:fucose permease
MRTTQSTHTTYKQSMIWTRFAWASYVLNGSAAVLGGAVLPDIMADFHLRAFWGGLFVAAPAIGVVSAGIFSAQIISNYGFKKIMIISLATLALSLLAISCAGSTFALLLFALCLGLANGTIEMSGNALIAGLHPWQTARELNRLHFMFGIGAFISPIGVTLIIRWGLGWHIIYLFVAMLLLGLVAFLSCQPDMDQLDQQKIEWREMAHLFQKLVIIQIWLGAIFLLSAEAGVSGWITTYLRQVKLFSPEISSLSLSLIWIAMLIGRYFNTWIPTNFTSVKIILIETLASGSALLIVLFSKQVMIVLMGLILLGLSMAGLYPTLMAYASALHRTRLHLVSGIFVTGVGLGKLTGPAAIGGIADWADLSLAMYVPVLLLAGLALIFILPRIMEHLENKTTML